MGNSTSFGSGGTYMWCPTCKSTQTCKAIPAARITGRTTDYRQRRASREHPDIHWFQRGRECLSCGHNFVTVEVDRSFLDELIELRDALADVKINAEQYVAQSMDAAESLERLTASLQVLQALNVYREA